MQNPNIPHKVLIPEKKITIVVWAYRKLDSTEVQRYAIVFARSHKLKRGHKYDVITTVR